MAAKRGGHPQAHELNRGNKYSGPGSGRSGSLNPASPKDRRDANDTQNRKSDAAVMRGARTGSSKKD